jgi:hypothetical protein
MPAHTRRAPVNHDLKCWPEFFDPVRLLHKPFEIRKNDREPKFQTGDTLTLLEFVPCCKCAGSGWSSDGGGCSRDAERCDCPEPHGTYTGRKVIRAVTYITSWMQQFENVVMGIKPL